MPYRASSAADAYTLSLGGMTAIASFAAAPAIAADQINKLRDARMKEIRQIRKQAPRGWRHDHRLAAHSFCA